jgi:hypothetical protein
VTPTSELPPSGGLALGIATETISLTFSTPRRLSAVAMLVAGGIGNRFGLSVERVGELQLALSTLVDRAPDDGETTVEFRVEEDSLQCRVWPVDDVEDTLPLIGRLVDLTSTSDVGGVRRADLVVRRDRITAST